jgi:hypothetical protein
LAEELANNPMRILLFVLLPLLVTGCRSVGQSPVRTEAPEIRRIHPAPGTAIVRFEELDEGVYKGSKPKTEADYEFLQSKGVKYIVELRLFPGLNLVERKRAKAHGMILIPATINASPLRPEERHVNHVLCLLHDPRYRPVYIHCDLGRDRAMLIAGLYGMYYRGISKNEAYRSMKHYGFKDGWTLRGLKSYFEKHSESPVEQYVPHCDLPAPPEPDRGASANTAVPETQE